MDTQGEISFILICRIETSLEINVLLCWLGTNSLYFLEEAGLVLRHHFASFSSTLLGLRNKYVVNLPIICFLTIISTQKLFCHYLLLAIFWDKF